jgi:peptidase M28-like protein/PDZ domain-containing protein
MRLPISRLLAAAFAITLSGWLPGCAGLTTGSRGAATPDTTAIRRDIAYLASDALEGRGTGTPGNDSAAAYIARRYAALGLRQPALGYVQPFVANSIALAHAGLPSALPTQNVVAIVPGRDAVLRNEYVVFGAHFDHLGRSTDGALDPDAKDAIRNGADDNASGTAAVMELARLFAAHPARRSVLFVNFSGEELGLLGSRWFVEHSPVPLDSVVAMVNFDMVGRLRDDKLIVYGVATATELRAIVDSANTAHLRLTAQGDGYGPSDHSSFYEKNIPVLHFFTDLHDDYHKATDDVEKINAGGEGKVVAMAERVGRALGDRPTRLTFVRMAPPAQTMSGREGSSSTYLGSVPDMAAGDVKGVRLSGVRPGSPAEQAGLKGGDVIVELGGKSVKDLYEYTDALYAHQPGEEVAIVVLRDGQRVELRAKLGHR